MIEGDFLKIVKAVRHNAAFGIHLQAWFYIYGAYITIKMAMQAVMLSLTPLAYDKLAG
jgi:hypothetical protein